MKLLIRNGTIIDPLRASPEFQADILVEDGIITRIELGLTDAADEVLDATGLTVTAGLVDSHVHLREPGREDKETIATGTASAVMGGITSVLAMPNTTPPICDQATVEFVKARAAATGHCRVFVSGNPTKGAKGEELSEMWEMKNCGVKVIADDVSGEPSKELTYRILEYLATHDLTLHTHAELRPLDQPQSLAEGWTATQLGLPGTPDSSEYADVARLLMLLSDHPARVHLTQMSTAGSLEVIRAAKAKGISVTCDTMPHYLLLTDEANLDYNTNAKVFPPIRDEKNRQALIEGLKDGTIDLLASDHAPHTLVEKYVEYERAAVGLVGLETFFPVLYTGLVLPGIISLPRLIELTTINPARMIREDVGQLAVGKPADLTVWNLNDEYVLDPETFQSKARNCPWKGRTVQGKAVHTIVGGKIQVKDGVLMSRS